LGPIVHDLLDLGQFFLKVEILLSFLKLPGDELVPVLHVVEPGDHLLAHKDHALELIPEVIVLKLILLKNLEFLRLLQPDARLDNCFHWG
jgi:hypothetical protein